MSATVIKGTAATHIHHTSGRIEVSDRKTTTIVQQGKYADLQGKVPGRGTTFQGLDVVSATLTPQKGGMALLSVTGTAHKASSYSAPGTPDEIVYEVEMAQLEKPLLSAPAFSGYAEQVELWKAGDPATRALYQYDDAQGNRFQLGGQALVAAKLILKGVESYLVFAPVARRTSRYAAKKAEQVFSSVGAACGKRQTPPAKLTRIAGGTWEWLKTADRVQENSGGGCERVEEWTGADEWDHDLYQNGGTAS